MWYISWDLVSQILQFEQICEIKNPQTFIFLRKMGASLIGCVMQRISTRNGVQISL